MKNSLITGCSWPAGEWGTISGNHQITHRGLNLFLNDLGYDVINLSQPGSDNWNTFRVLQSFLKVNSHINLSHILYFQTDIGRSFKFHTPSKSKNLTDEINRLYLELYRHLDQLAMKNNCTIHVIGGLTDVVVSLQNFKNLKLCLDSWCRLIDPALPLTGLVDQTGIEFLDDHGYDKKQIESIIDQSWGRIEFFNSNPYYFQPDGQHPNRLAHKLLVEYLSNYV
jgi:hypothetical protein